MAKTIRLSDLLTTCAVLAVMSSVPAAQAATLTSLTRLIPPATFSETGDRLVMPGQFSANVFTTNATGPTNPALSPPDNTASVSSTMPISFVSNTSVIGFGGSVVSNLTINAPRG